MLQPAWCVFVASREEGQLDGRGNLLVGHTWGREEPAGGVHWQGGNVLVSALGRKETMRAGHARGRAGFGTGEIRPCRLGCAQPLGVWPSLLKCILGFDSG